MMKFMATRQKMLDRMRELVPALKGGRPYIVTVKEARPRRTLNQNALFHAIIGEISRDQGADFDLLKEGIKERYGVRERVTFGNKVYEVAKPSHLCDTVEMGKLIDGALLEAAELGIDVLSYRVDWNEIRKRNEAS